jgi:glutamate racemase
MGMRSPVAFMDSGIGGLPYLETARSGLRPDTFVYLADRAGFPYGTKRREELEAIVLDRVGRLVAAWRPRALVIACNTASQVALSAVRDVHPGLPVIGTVPAIKPAAERSRSGCIGVLATAGAVDDPYLDDLVDRFAAGVRVMRRAAQDLVEFIEHRFLDSTASERRAAVLPHVAALVSGGVDQIVLACTHFLHIAPDITACATELCREGDCGPVEVVDSREGVVRRLRQILDEGLVSGEGDAAKAENEGGGRGYFLLTGPQPFEPAYGVFARRFGLSGPLPLDGHMST